MRKVISFKSGKLQRYRIMFFILNNFLKKKNYDKVVQTKLNRKVGILKYAY